jgi:hypothetical protein
MHKIDTKIYNERLEEVMMIKILMEKQSYSAPRKGFYELHTTEGWEFLFFHHLQLLEILDAKMRIKKKKKKNYVILVEVPLHPQTTREYERSARADMTLIQCC